LKEFGRIVIQIGEVGALMGELCPEQSASLAK
jgi:hypothetical protein